MASATYQTIDEYISNFPMDVQPVLEKVRRTIKETAPEAQEKISYRIPTFTLDGRYLVYFAGFKNHVSLYPAPRGVASFENAMAKYQGGKGTVRFPLDKPLPLTLIRRIVKYRLKETREAQKKKSAPSRPRRGAKRAARPSRS